MLAAGAGTAALVFYAAQSVEDRIGTDLSPAIASTPQRLSPTEDEPNLVTGSIPEPADAAATQPPGPVLRLSRSGDTIRIAGAVGDTSSLADFRAAAREAFPTAGLEASLRGDPALGSDIAQAGLAAVAALARLAEGEALIEEGVLALEGRALYPQTQQAVRERLASLAPTGWRIDLAVEEPATIETSAAICEGRLAAALASAPIVFAVASARLADETQEHIDQLAAILEDCEDVSVEIGGHTDSDGPEATNVRISQSRAEAVREALLARGVDPDRVAAVGYGDARPVAPNDTDENKALNRRIEIVVQR
ncbi:MAG: OmpA family protein [Salinarimonadaceae bacterium]|nr:MAG: OmpA family protein [Salinarimonadaceae bacterium]